MDAKALTFSCACPGAEICPEAWSSWIHGAAFRFHDAVQLTAPVPIVQSVTVAETGWVYPWLTGPNAREVGLTQFKPAEVMVAEGVRVIVGDGVAEPVSVEEGDGVMLGG